MTVRITTSVTLSHGTYTSGQVLNLSTPNETDLIRRGYAVQTEYGLDTYAPTITPIDLMDFEAKGDGVTDDSTALERAFAAAAAAGVPCIIPPRTFGYSRNLVANCSIIGSGAASFLKNIGSKGQNSMISIASVDGLILRDFKMGAVGADGTYVSENDCNLRLTGCTNFTISGLFFKDISGTAVLTYSSNGGSVYGNKIDGSYKDGFHFTDGCKNISVIGNRIKNNGDDCIAVVSYTAQTKNSNIAIQGNTVETTKSGRGITVVGGERIVISGNTVRETYTGGIYVASESGGSNTTAPENIVVMGNHLYRCGRNSPANAPIHVSGVASYPPKHITIQGNQILESSYRAITVFGVSSYPAENIRILNNTIFDTTDLAGKNATAGTGQDAGINASAYVHNLEIVGNHIEQAGGYGIYCEATMTGRVAIEKNTFQNVNVNGTTLDCIHVATANTAQQIIITDNYLHTQTATLDRFIDCNNGGKTLARNNRALVENGASTPIAIGQTTTSITVTGSAFSFTNSNAFPIVVRVIGGTVSLIEKSGNGTNYVTLPSTGGLVHLDGGQIVRVTYSVAPTMNYWPANNA